MGNFYEYVHSGSFNMEQENQGFQIRHPLVKFSPCQILGEVFSIGAYTFPKIHMRAENIGIPKRISSFWNHHFSRGYLEESSFFFRPFQNENSGVWQVSCWKETLVPSKSFTTFRKNPPVWAGVSRHVARCMKRRRNVGFRKLKKPKKCGSRRWRTGCHTFGDGDGTKCWATFFLRGFGTMLM